MSKKRLTIKQKRFADEYIISGNIYEAALKAGYSRSYAKADAGTLIKKPHMTAYIDKRLEKIEAAKYLTMDEALRITASIARGEPKEIEVEIDGVMVKQKVYPAFRDQKDSLDHFYKINGAFIDRLEVNADVSTSESIKRIDEYLKEKLEDDREG